MANTANETTLIGPRRTRRRRRGGAAAAAAVGGGGGGGGGAGHGASSAAMHRPGGGTRVVATPVVRGSCTCRPMLRGEDGLRPASTPSLSRAGTAACQRRLCVLEFIEQLAHRMRAGGRRVPAASDMPLTRPTTAPTPALMRYSQRGTRAHGCAAASLCGRAPGRARVEPERLGTRATSGRGSVGGFWASRGARQAEGLRAGGGRSSSRRGGSVQLPSSTSSRATARPSSKRGVPARSRASSATRACFAALVGVQVLS